MIWHIYHWLSAACELVRLDVHNGTIIGQHLYTRPVFYAYPANDR